MALLFVKRGENEVKPVAVQSGSVIHSERFLQEAPRASAESITQTMMKMQNKDIERTLYSLSFRFKGRPNKKEMIELLIKNLDRLEAQASTRPAPSDNASSARAVAEQAQTFYVLVQDQNERDVDELLAMPAGTTLGGLASRFGGSDAHFVLKLDLGEESEEESAEASSDVAGGNPFLATGSDTEDVESITDYVERLAVQEEEETLKDDEGICITVQECRESKVLCNLGIPHPARTSVEELKEHICSAISWKASAEMKPEMFKLVCNGKAMEDEHQVSDYVSPGRDGLTVFLVLVMKGGGKPKPVKKNRMDKTSRRDKIAETVAFCRQHDIAKTPPFVEANATMSNFWTACETDAVKGFDDILEKLNQAQVEKCAEAISSKSGGSNTFKLDKLSEHLFGFCLHTVKDVLDVSSGYMETASLTVNEAFECACKQNESFDMVSLRKLVEQKLNKKKGQAEGYALAIAEVARAQADAPPADAPMP
eukprot:s706_g23.t1